MSGRYTAQNEPVRKSGFAAAGALCALIVIAALIVFFSPAGARLRACLSSAKSPESGVWLPVELPVTHEARYAHASSLFTCRRYEAARIEFSKLGQYRDSEERLLDCTYMLALFDFKRGNYYEALTVLSSLRGYRSSEEISRKCLEPLYLEAEALKRSCDYSRAAELFSAVAPYKLSATLRDYCIEMAEMGEIEHPYFTPERPYTRYSAGRLYESFKTDTIPALVYVPDGLNENTKSLVYYAGGSGDAYLLYLYGVKNYVDEYQPDALILWLYQSGYNRMHSFNAAALSMMKQLSAECGIALNDMVLAGSSKGCYTAVHAAAQFFTEGKVPVKAVLSLDAGNDWGEDRVLSAAECEQLSEAGTELLLLEQRYVGLQIPAIKLMVDKNCNVTIVKCHEAGHDSISVYAYLNGVFSWALREYDKLDPEQYMVVSLHRTNASVNEYAE